MTRTAKILLAVIALVTMTVAVTVVVDTAPSGADQNEGVTNVDTQRLIAVGGLHTCSVMDDGEVRCWGDNANGQLGNGTRAVSTEPHEVTGITDAVAVTAGNTHSCAIRKNATVVCWGLNSNGQVGANPVLVNASLVPVPVPGLTDVRAIAAGGFHNCALLDTGHVKCWGLDGAGQLGDGAGTPTGDTFNPVEVSGLTDAVALAAGEFHTCALLATGGVKCWGHNGFGQLGNDSAVDATSPVAVSGLPDGTKRAIAITAGYGHSCAVVEDDAPGDGDTVRCWGNNTQGQLGDGSTTDRDTPVIVQFDQDGDPSDLVYDFVNFKGADVVTAGQNHTCARKVGGTAWCWGNAARGQLGNGTRGEGDVNPFLPHDGPGSERRQMWRSAKPVSIPAVSAITAGGFHTCALIGTLMQCWGYNFYGQLGSYQGSSAVPVTVTALQAAESVAVGTDSACARILVPGTPDTHQPVCWGTNANGELGAGLTPASVPSTTIAVKVSGLADVSALTAGNGHACTLPTGSQSPRCWGRNGSGQLGDNTTTGANAPVNVSGLTTATQVSAGGRFFTPDEIGHTCARLADGTAQCWGDNQFGQVGNNSMTASFSTPQTVLYDADPLPPDPPDDDHFDPQPLGDIVAVAAGGSHSCALRDDGSETTVWCWGRNANGQLGDNTVANVVRLATQVKLIDDPDPDEPDTYLTGVKAITAGERHTCALLNGADDGKVRCWGANGSGQLGDGTFTERHLPKLIPSIPSGVGVTRTPLAVALTAGMSHTCAVMDNASARCWGSNGDGQLGSGGGTSNVPVTPVGLDNDTADTIRAEAGVTPDDLVTSLSAGRRNTCASLIDKTVSCWGSNSSGQLGDGVGPTRLTPIGVLHLDEGVNGNRSPSAADDTASTPEDTAVAKNVLANDSDPDADTITVLQVKDPAHGTATTDGTNVTYTPDLDFCGVDPVSYRIFDGNNGVADAILTVTVTCLNDPPVAVDDVATTAEDNAVTVNVLANDTDPDTGDTRSVLSITQPTHGATTIVGGGLQVQYTPQANYTGPDAFTYVVKDAAGLTDSGAVSITVTPANDPPDAVDDPAATSEDSPVVVAVLGNDTDIDGDTLTVQSITQPAHGTTLIVAGGVRYTPAPDYPGPTDTFTYVVSDGHGGTDTATVTVTISAAADAPIANDDTAGTTQDTVTTILVLANDTDVDGDTLTVQSVTQPSHGTTTIEPGGPGGTAVKYTPTPGYNGADSFTYVASDGNGGTDSALVSVTVAPGNYPPFAGDDHATTAEDVAVTVPVLANDYDPDGPTPPIDSVTQPAHGTTAIVAGGVKYTPAANFWGTDSFTYVVKDAQGATDLAAVAVTVTAVADPPDAINDPVATPEDTPVTINVLGNDVDPDGDVVTLTSATQPANGSTAIVAGKVKYTPALNYVGPDSFTYDVSDGHGGVDTATVNVTVSAVNDPPTIAAITDKTTPWGSLLTVVPSANDVDGGPLSYSLLTSPGAGASVHPGSGTFTWTPAAADIGLRTVTIRVSDGAANADVTFKVNVTKQATTLSYTGAVAGQYSDAVVVSSLLTAGGGSPVTLAPVSYTLAGQSAVGATTDGTGTSSSAITLTAAAGASTVVATYAGSAAYLPSSVSTPFTVNPETATVTVTGPFLVITAGSSATATMTAAVQEAADGSLGTALGAAQVQFTDVSGAPLCTTTVTPTTPGSGTASCNTAALALGSRGVVAKLLSPRYAADLDVAALAVAATVPTGAAAGGGHVPDGSGGRANFAFRATPAKKGAPTGDAIQVFRQMANLGSGLRAYAFVVSTPTLTSMSTSCTAKTPKVCSANVQGSGAATVAVDVQTGAVPSVAGAATIQINATDAAEPVGNTVPPDRYAVAIAGPKPFTVGTASSQVLLAAGNIRVA